MQNTKSLRFSKTTGALFILFSLLVSGCDTTFSILSSLSGSGTQNSSSFKLGVNLSNLAGGNTFPGTINFDFAAPTEADFIYYHSRGLNFVRLPIRWERVQPTLNGPLDPTYLGYVTTVVGYARAHNMTVLIDVHNYAIYNTNKIGDGTLTAAHLADLWQRLATVFKGDTGIAGYDLMNEPVGLSSPQVWHAAAQAAVTAIRQIDADTPIYVEGYNWASAGEWTTYNNDLNIIDPSNKIIYSAHTYIDRDSSGTHFIWGDEVAAGVDVNTGVTRLKVFTDWLEQHNFRGHLGEIGVGNNDPGWNTALDNTLAFAKAHGVEVNYWAGGPWWGNYGYSSEPESGNKQAKQMAVLTKYTGAASPTVYYTSGPVRGTSGVQSTDFTVDYRGNVSSPVTISLSDNGAGGTFAPTSVTLQPGFNPTATFKYTPAIVGTIKITTTNSAGWTNPTDLGLATAPDLFMVTTATPNNIFAFRRIYSPYVGPIVRLQRDLDNAQQDFYVTAAGDLDRSAIQTWAGGPTSMVRLIKWYDQSPAGNHIVPVFSVNNVGGSSPRDYPIFLLDAGDGYPAIRFESHRADFKSPLTAITGQTIITRIKHVSGTNLFSGQFSTYNNWLSSGNWNMSVEASANLDMGLIANEWHTYEGTWSANTVNGWKTYRDGSLVASHDAQATSFTLDVEPDVYNMGWFRWWATTRWYGDIREAIIFGGALSAADITAYNTNMDTYYTTPLPALPAASDQVVVPVSGPTLPNKFKGTNLAGAEGGSRYAYLNYDYTYPTTTEIDYYAAKGFTAIRLPFDANKLQPVRNAVLNTAELAQINKVVQYCRTKGLWVILDPHNFGQLNNSDGVARVIGVDTDMPASTLANLWTRLAGVYVNQPNVIFALMNEPHFQTATEWKAVAVAAVNAIRATGATQKILIPGTEYTGAHSWVTSGNAAAWAGFTDSNFAYEVHQYLDSDSSGTHAACSAGTGSTQLAPFDTWARANGVQGFLGEVGWSTDSSCPTEGAAIMSYMTSKPDVWMGWTYWAGGPWLSTYMYNLDPTGLGTTSVVDQPQMSILMGNL